MGEGDPRFAAPEGALKRGLWPTEQARMAILPFVLFGLAWAALVAVLVVKGRAKREARRRALEGLGFVPCPSESQDLVEQVTRHENDSQYRYRIREPFRTSLLGKPVWFYEKERARQGKVVAARELRFPLARPSPDALVLFFKPSALAPGTTVTRIGSLATEGWDSQPDDLTRLEIPIDLQGSNLIGVLGPRGASLYDLIDAKDLATLQPVGDLGVSSVHCRGSWCSFGGHTTRIEIDLEGLWPIVQQLTGSETTETTEGRSPR